VEVIVAPSLLALDDARSGKRTESAGRFGADWPHFNIMDDCAHAGTGIFVVDTNLFGSRGLKSAVTKLRHSVGETAPR
jgi:pentose-5-phosphate-3-epimerase